MDLSYREKITQNMCKNPQEKIISEVEKVWFTPRAGKPRSGKRGGTTDYRISWGTNRTIEGQLTSAYCP